MRVVKNTLFKKNVITNTKKAVNMMYFKGFLYTLCIMPTLISAAATSAHEEKQEMSPVERLKWLKEHEPYAGEPQFFLTVLDIPKIHVINQKGYFAQNNYDQESQSHIRRLTTTPLVSDERKVQKDLVMIPFFQQLRGASKQVHEKHMQTVNEIEPALHPDSLGGKYDRRKMYALRRILMAGECYASDVTNRPDTFMKDALEESLVKRDAALTDILLRSETTLPEGISLRLAHTARQAAALIERGASVLEEHKQRDMIMPCCGWLCTNKEKELIPLFLPYIPLDDSNNHGKEWVKALALQGITCLKKEKLKERLKLLLAGGCQYDKETITQAFGNKNYRENGSAERKQAFLEVLEAHENEKGLQHVLDPSLEMNQKD